MKKFLTTFIVIALALSLILALASCNGDNGDNGENCEVCEKANCICETNGGEPCPDCNKAVCECAPSGGNEPCTDCNKLVCECAPSGGTEPCADCNEVVCECGSSGGNEPCADCEKVACECSSSDFAPGTKKHLELLMAELMANALNPAKRMQAIETFSQLTYDDSEELRYENFSEMIFYLDANFFFAEWYYESINYEEDRSDFSAQVIVLDFLKNLWLSFNLDTEEDSLVFDEINCKNGTASELREEFLFEILWAMFFGEFYEIEEFNANANGGVYIIEDTEIKIGKHTQEVIGLKIYFENGVITKFTMSVENYNSKEGTKTVIEMAVEISYPSEAMLFPEELLALVPENLLDGDHSDCEEGFCCSLLECVFEYTCCCGTYQQDICTRCQRCADCLKHRDNDFTCCYYDGAEFCEGCDRPEYMCWCNDLHEDCGEYYWDCECWCEDCEDYYSICDCRFICEFGCGELYWDCECECEGGCGYTPHNCYCAELCDYGCGELNWNCDCKYLCEFGCGELWWDCTCICEGVCGYTPLNCQCEHFCADCGEWEYLCVCLCEGGCGQPINYTCWCEYICEECSLLDWDCECLCDGGCGQPIRWECYC
ncbi:MAG: hypothetical protein FWD49_05875 [Firmicutes bacterium]|nr:hypothetical protein [Bacillota bacterium]